MWCTLLALAVLAVHSVICQSTAKLPESCDSQIYCYGDLLHTVQLAKLYSDSKTFVDLKLTRNQSEVLSDFKELKKKYEDNIPNEKLKTFVDTNFIDCSSVANCSELNTWVPPDWTESPAIIGKIKNNGLKKFASELNAIWKHLSRKMDRSVLDDADRTSLIYVPNGFVIPGGRFKELYYWDTYWIVAGLLICEMQATAAGIIQNLLALVQQFGHIPNGSRVYYKQRTQPPMLTSMVDLYVKTTGNKSFIEEHIDVIDKELSFYLSHRRVTIKKNGKSYQLFHYYAPSLGPRPESYREDYELAANLSESEKTPFYSSIKSAAESGWDFSSRWFIAANKTNEGTLADIHSEYIIPVDLNSILHKNFMLMAGWYSNLGNSTRAKYFKKVAEETLEGIQKLLWNEKDKIWYDYDNLNGIPRKYMYLSNFVPLWTSSHSMPKHELSRHMEAYVAKHGLLQFVGGTPTSFDYSGEQWDFPNAWPPLQAFVIQGLDRIGTNSARQLAYEFANQWVSNNYAGYQKFSKMYEKYNALEFGEGGSGGEYEGQDGFGWTNGFLFELLERYSKFLIPETRSKCRMCVKYERRDPITGKRQMKKVCHVC